MPLDSTPAEAHASRRVHPRDAVAEKARRELDDALAAWAKQFGLTACEEASLLAGYLGRRLGRCVDRCVDRERRSWEEGR